MATCRRTIRGVLIDLSGTLHIEDNVIPGCVEALAKLFQQKQYNVRFVTNTTKMSSSKLLAQLHRIGFTMIQANQIVTSGRLARDLLEKEQLRPFFIIDDRLQGEFDGLNGENPNAVVIGLAPEHFNYDKINGAFRVLMNGGQLIALHEGRYFAAQDGLDIGPGAFVKGLEFATGVRARVIGKPSPGYFQCALDDMHCKAEEAVMIGDDLIQDCGGANAIGMQSILVQTGKFRPQDLMRTDVTRPSFVAADFAQAVEWILSQEQEQEP